jgi:hypothetical protein
LQQFVTLSREMRWSIVAFIATLILGLLSMGALGLLIYYPVDPILRPFFGDSNEWHGDWVWPSIVGAGMGWSFSFLVAGLINRWLEKAEVQKLSRKVIYVLILWLGSALIWLLLLMVNQQA